MLELCWKVRKNGQVESLVHCYKSKFSVLDFKERICDIL